MSDVDKLQALLTRVQEKRGGAPAAAPAPEAAPAWDPAPTPLELAVEEELRQPAPTPAAAPAPAAPAPAAPAPSFDPAPTDASQPEVLSLPPLAVSTPVAHVVSPQPPLAEAAFGELLRRTLALRPR